MVLEGRPVNRLAVQWFYREVWQPFLLPEGVRWTIVGANADPSLTEDGGTDWEIEIQRDPGAKTLHVIDNGIGMSPENVVEQLGTIARSGTKEFLATLKASDAAERPELIGQFGVGFYSSWLVADRVEVVSRAAGQDAAWRWVSEAKSEFSVETAERLEAEAIHISRWSARARLVDAAHGRGLAVRVFPVNQAWEYELMVRLGVDGIFTDYPERALAWGAQAPALV